MGPLEHEICLLNCCFSQEFREEIAYFENYMDQDLLLFLPRKSLLFQETKIEDSLTLRIEKWLEPAVTPSPRV